jgi:protein-disulfide isomerase
MLRSIYSALTAVLFSVILTGAVSAQDGTVEDMIMGADDAPVTIIEYASYTCPHCASFHAGAYKNLKADYIDTGKVKFIYREVYFDRFGLWASMIARCAGPDRFFGVTDVLYAEQSQWARAGDPAAIVGELRKIGKVAGLTDEMLDACMQDAGKAQSLVNWYQANAEADDISSTPSFLINGTKHSNMPYSELSALIDAEIGG